MMLSHRTYIEESFRDVETYTGYVGEEPPDEARQLWDFSRQMTARVTWKPYMFNRRLEPLLGDLQVPTLVVWGGKDNVVPLGMRRAIPSGDSQFPRFVMYSKPCGPERSSSGTATAP